MIPKYEVDLAVEAAKKYGVGRLYLIGSALKGKAHRHNDYDFAVSGVPGGNFFKFYGELFRILSKNVDLIDLSGRMTRFKKIVRRDGKLIYEKT